MDDWAVLAILAVLVVLAIPVAVIYLLVAMSGVKARLTALEAQLGAGAVDLGALAPRLPDAAGIAQAVVVAEPEVSAEPAAQAPPPALGPWSQAAEPEAVVVIPAEPRKPSALLVWLRENWVYAVSAASLALAGVFFVQYGIENGLLPPVARVAASIAFGLCLIGAGEWLRRRGGDEEASSTAYLPQVFAGAGLVSIFAAVLAARQMYGLIGPEVAFAGHLITAAAAVALGWFYGPLLAAVGLLGAAAAPFLVAGGSAPTGWLYGYYTLIAAVGLAVDAVRRWPWVSRLALILGYGGGWLMMAGGAGALGFEAMLVVLALLAVAVPVLQLVPRHAGPSLSAAVLLRLRPGREVLLAAGAVLASSVLLMLFTMGPSGEAMAAFGALTLLALALILWAERAEGLADLALLPAAGFLGALALVGFEGSAVLWEFRAVRGADVAMPLTDSWLLAMAGAMSAGFALRSFRAEPQGILHVLGAVLVAPVAAAVLELLWTPALVEGVYPWALQIMALAGLMVALALRYARLGDQRALAYATLSALSLIALALFELTTRTALTLALGVLVVAAAGLDRRFKLPEMGWFIQAAVAVLGYRLLADPGLEFAFMAPVGSVLLGFVGVIAALLAGLWLLRDLERPLPKGVMESAAAGFAAILANVLISRWLMPEGMETPGNLQSHWGASLNALPWLVLMLMQIYRARLGGTLLRLRQAIALVAGVLAAGGLAVAVGPLNPLFVWSGDAGGRVLGPMVLDTLLLAYGVPGLILLAAALRLPGVGRRLRIGFIAVGAALGALYVGLEIRRWFQGDYLGGGSVTQGELYTYTLAMMLLGAALLYQAIAKRSNTLRKVAMAVIGITVVKVFLLDAAGLTGLTRVVSFLGLGLSLAGLAWLNRWAGRVSA
ncbi:MAG: DUF2339 domain-containing protein [Cypionkella sp.]